jgi:hypothetical protein
MFLWPNSRNSLLKVVVDQETPVMVGFQPVVEVDLVQIGRYQNLESGKPPQSTTG